MPDTSNCMRARGGIYAKIKNHIRKALHGIVVLGLIFSAMGATSRSAVHARETETGITPDASTTGRVPDSTNQCLTKVVRITLASEQINFCTPISQPYNVIEDNISDPNVSYAQLNQVNGYGIVNIKSVTPGYTPGIGRPIYDLDGVDEYRQAVWDIESSKTDRVVSNGPTGVFWNETVPGIQIDVSLPMSLGNMKVRTIEWYVEHNSRLWSFIITWDTEIENSNEWNESSKNFSIQKPEGAKFADTAIDLGTAFQVSNAASGNADSGIPPVDVGTPAWWSGVCDDDNYFKATGVHSFLLRVDGVDGSWHGVPACGPVTFRPPYPSHVVHFFPGAWGEIEFECVELVMRFLYQEWGIAPWPGNANKIKNSPPDSIDFYNNNGTQVFVPGDIITEDGITQNSPGHTVIITGVNLDEYGTGSISILEQNASSNGSRLLTVTKWKIDPDAYTWGQTIQGWLHAKANHGLTVTISGNVGTGDATLSFDDNGPQTASAASDGTYSLTVPYNWSGMVMPSKTGYPFTPASRTYTNTTVGQRNQNYTATNSFTGSAYVPDRITFTTTGSLNVGRYGHTATLLNNGQVLVAGGQGSDTPNARAELYDPATGTWTGTGSMNVGRSSHTATLLNDGSDRVLVAGGTGGETSAELYDPATRTWTPTGRMNVGRRDHTATLLNGKVLVAGGYDGLASAELYDPSTGIWSTTGSMNTGRYIHTATLLNNGQVLVAGGLGGGEPGEHNNLTSAELYDPALGTWSTTGNMNAARGTHTATLLDNGKVLVAGGFGPLALASAELYDPSTDTWSNASNMNAIRGTYTATLLNNGQVLVVGGTGTQPYLASAESYDPSTGAWITTGSMNVGRYAHTATLLKNSKVLVAGGWNGSPLASAELGTLIPGNTFTGTLTLPAEWLSNTTISAQFVGTSSGVAINAGALSNDNNSWDDWVAATSDVTTTTTWDVSGEGANKPVYLRLRDFNDQVTTVVTGTVNVDFTKPVGSVTIAPVNAGMGESASVPTPQVGASSTQTFTVYLPLIIKSLQVNLILTATDGVSGVGGMLISNNMDFSGANWEVYTSQKSWGLIGTTVYVKFRDNAGNVSPVYSATYTP